HTLSFANIDSTCITVRECNHQVAAKTGTTDGFKDNLAIGYTPNIVVGVWVGNANGKEMLDTIGITGAAPIWRSVIERAAGYCPANTIPDDNIACGSFNLGLGSPTVFPKPDGL
ncbi:MAG: glycosyl transferase family 51, partial [Ktedonobacteraceae bacterium]|nr:glycosyl transferase family 51 [Ktedonobacteraceae bacterium]